MLSYTFPSGRYGEFHPHTVNLAFSEYIKSNVIIDFAKVQSSFVLFVSKGNASVGSGYLQCLKFYRQKTPDCQTIHRR